MQLQHATSAQLQQWEQELAEEYARFKARNLNLDLSQSWMVGDILDDVEAGRRAGCRSVLLDVGNETVWRGGPLRTPHLRAADLLDAARQITGLQTVPSAWAELTSKVTS